MGAATEVLVEANVVAREEGKAGEKKLSLRAEGKPKPIVINHGAWGGVWFGGWLFTIALAKLVWWKAILGLVVWPYYLGQYVAGQ